jgi:hypothetical protein
MHKSRYSLIALVTLMAAILACSVPTPTPVLTPLPSIDICAVPDMPTPTKGATIEVTPTTVPPTPPPDVRGPGFAAYPSLPVSLPDT